MANALTPTVFSSGAKDALATLDVYKAKGTSVVTSIQDLSKAVGFDVSKLLGGKSNKDLQGVLSIAAGAIKVNKDELTTRLLGANSKLTSAFRSLSDGAKDAMGDTFDSLKSIRTTINGVTSVVNSSDFTSLQGLGNFLGQYTKNDQLFSFEDTDGMSSMMCGLVEEGSNLGISNVFSTITDGIVDRELLQQLTTKSVPKLLQTGDVLGLLDISDSKVGSSLKGLFPNFAADLTKNFRQKVNGELRDDLGMFAKATSLLFNVDSQWDSLVRENGADTAVNIFALMATSRDFQELVATGVKALADDDPKKMYLFHNLFQKTTVEDELRRNFPRVALLTKAKNRVDKKRGTVDPRDLTKLAGIGGLMLAGLADDEED